MRRTVFAEGDRRFLLHTHFYLSLFHIFKEKCVEKELPSNVMYPLILHLWINLISA